MKYYYYNNMFYDHVAPSILIPINIIVAIIIAFNCHYHYWSYNNVNKDKDVIMRNNNNI